MSHSLLSSVSRSQELPGWANIPACQSKAHTSCIHFFPLFGDQRLCDLYWQGLYFAGLRPLPSPTCSPIRPTPVYATILNPHYSPRFLTKLTRSQCDGSAEPWEQPPPSGAVPAPLLRRKSRQEEGRQSPTSMLTNQAVSRTPSGLSQWRVSGRSRNHRALCGLGL